MKALWVTALCLLWPAVVLADFDRDLRLAYQALGELDGRGHFGHQAALNLAGDIDRLFKGAGNKMNRLAKVGSLMEKLERRATHDNTRGRNADLALRKAKEKIGSKLATIEIDPSSMDREFNRLVQHGKIVTAGGKKLGKLSQTFKTLSVKDSWELEGEVKARLSTGTAKWWPKGSPVPQGHSFPEQTKLLPGLSAADQHIASSLLKDHLKAKGAKDSGRRVLLRGSGGYGNPDATVVGLFEPKTGRGIVISTPKDGRKSIKRVRVVPNRHRAAPRPR